MARAKSIVAVFDIQFAKGVSTSESKEALTDYLAVRVAATGAFRVIPRSQIKQRLTRLKVESYKDCYDQSCQIELGRELAANKSLATRVMVMGGQCVLALTLFDLKKATTELAHTAEFPAEPDGRCADSAMMTAIINSVDRLAGHGDRQQDTPQSRPSAAGADVTVIVESDPSRADVLVDGLTRGKTPLNVALKQDQEYKLTLFKKNYELLTRTLRPKETSRLELTLQPTPAGRLDLATTSEWFGLGLGSGGLGGSAKAGVGFTMRIANIKWHRFFWTVFEFNALFATASSQGSGRDGAIFPSTRAGYPLYLGSRGQHQLFFGLGLGYALVYESTSTTDSSQSSSDGMFALSPGMSYIYNAFNGMIPFGVTIKAILPAAGELGGGDYPYMVMGTLDVGMSLYRMITSASSMAKSRPRKARQ
jgi:hypothetical protein